MMTVKSDNRFCKILMCLNLNKILRIYILELSWEISVAIITNISKQLAFNDCKTN